MLATTVALSSCSKIDDDRDDCEVDFQAQYRMCLVTNENLEIARVLGEHTAIGNDLREHLKDVFTDYGHDLGLGFYALPDSVRKQPLRGALPTEMNATERSFEFFMPILDYMHLATSNVVSNGTVILRNDDRCHGASLIIDPTLSDTIASQQTGLFSGRRLLTDMTYGKQQYDMNMYMVNCADAIVLDPRTALFTDVKVYTRGFAYSFSVCDSLFHYEKPTVTRSERVTLNDTNWLCFCSVNLPSREPSNSTRLRVETDQPFLYADCDEEIWYYDCYVTMADGRPNGLNIKAGTITKTTLAIRHPLRAGQLKVILGWIDDRGVVHTDDQEVGVSIDLDWKPGIEFEW